MKNKVLKAMACMMSVCMLSMSLAGCGNDDAGSSNTPSSDTPTKQESSGGADDASTPDDGGEVDSGVEDQSGGLYPAYDLGGVELKVLTYNNIGDLNPDSDSLLPSDEDDEAAAAEKATKKQERQERKDYIEAKYNVKLTFVDLPTNDWAEIPSQLVMNYTSGNPDADIMDIYFQHIGTLINNNMLYDFTNDMDGRFAENGLFDWAGRTYGLGAYIAGEGLYYNKTMIKELGMDYTPAEMFAMGQWSYDDMFAYLQEMQSLMGEDDYPLFVDTLYWTIFAPMANGGQSLFGDNGDLRYLEKYGLETLEFYGKLVDSGLIPINAVYDPDSGELLGYDTWSYPGNTFDKGEHVAIAHRAAWQADGIDKSVVELGFVPYPWGSGTTVDSSKVGQEDAYLTLQNYKQACFDGQTVCLTNGIQNKADPMQVMSMVMEWMKWDSKMAAYEAPEDEVRTCGWLEEGLDADLYFWALDRTYIDSWYMLVKFRVSRNWAIAEEDVYYGGGSLRSALESAYNADMQSLIDNGYTTADVWSADFEMYDIETEE